MMMVARREKKEAFVEKFMSQFLSLKGICRLSVETKRLRLGWEQRTHVLGSELGCKLTF